MSNVVVSPVEEIALSVTLIRNGGLAPWNPEDP